MNRIIVAAVALELTGPFITWNFYYLLEGILVLSSAYLLLIAVCNLYELVKAWADAL